MVTFTARSFPNNPENSLIDFFAFAESIFFPVRMHPFWAPFVLRILVSFLVSISAIPTVLNDLKNSSKEFSALQLLYLEGKSLTTNPDDQILEDSMSSKLVPVFPI